MRTTILKVLLLVVFVVGLTKPAAAGLIILEGSDSQTYHSYNPYSTLFLTNLATFSSGSTLPIFIWTDTNSIAGTPPTGKVFGATLPSLVDLLANYAGVYAGSLGTCCDEHPITAAEAATLTAFGAAGRSVAIEDYQGNDVDWALFLGFDPSGSNVVGYNTTGGGSGCFDGNSITPTGQAFGLGPAGPIPPLGCFGHQAYELAFFTPLGFGPSLIDTSTFGAAYSVVLSNGGGGLVSVPEPASFLLLGTGFLAMVARRRRQA